MDRYNGFWRREEKRNRDKEVGDAVFFGLMGLAFAGLLAIVLAVLK